MLIGDRLRQLREWKNQSQHDIEKKTGLLRCYVSRVENGHTVPAIVTLEKFAHALEIPMYQIFYDKTDVPTAKNQAPKAAAEWASSGAPAVFFNKLRNCLGKMSSGDRDKLFQMTRVMNTRNARLEKRTGKRN